MRVLSPHNRVLAVIGGSGLLAALFLALTFVQLEALDHEIGRGYGTVADLQDATRRLTGVVGNRVISLQDYRLAGDSQALARYRDATALEDAIGAEIQDAAADLSQIAGAMTAVTAATDRWQAKVAEPAISLMTVGRAAPLLPDAEVARDYEAINRAVDHLAAVESEYSASIGDHNAALTSARGTATTAGLAITLMAALGSLWFVRRYGRALERDIKRAEVLKRFTEVTTFETDDRGLAGASLDALVLLGHPEAGVAHVLNASRDRAIAEATFGHAEARVLSLDALSGCPGVVRGSTYVTADAAVKLAVACPVFPVHGGTLACIPLAHGATIGAVHLHWQTPNAFPDDLSQSVARVAAHAALAIGNRRLLRLLEGQASTDPRTGLANSRTFDVALENELGSMVADDTLAVLMLDLDQFKDFNDRYGHPAGDEALCTFADVLRSCMRTEDLAARYGGEEFAVLLPGVDLATATAIAERIRAETEKAVVALGPGISARLTVSIGVAVAPLHASDRISLLQIADEALYGAKGAGRNLVRAAGPEPPTETPTAVGARHAA